MSVELVLASGQASLVLPNTALPPDYSVEDRSRNWFYYTPPIAGAQREVTVASPREIVRKVQEYINSLPEGTVPQAPVRDDGVLDTMTLDAASKLIPERWNGDLASGASFSRHLAQSAAQKRLDPVSYTGLILLSTQVLRAEPRANMAWIRGGGVALGANATIGQVKYPLVVESNFLDKSAPRVSNFVRKNKVPLLIAGGVVAVAAVGSVIYFNSKEV
jgi:hypothetical protein